MAGAGLEPGGGVGRGDATTDLHPPGEAPSAARAASSLPGPSMITCPPRRSSSRNRAANYSGGLIGDEVGGGVGVVAQRAPDDLLHLALVEIDARSEHGGQATGGAAGRPSERGRRHRRRGTDESRQEPGGGER